jgi:hypothetical protein
VPKVAVPEGYQCSPRREILSAGTELSRVHSSARSSTSFNERLAELESGGGRFDGTSEEPYEFLYAASEERAAVCEALLRELPPEPSGGRLLPMKAVKGRSLSSIVTSRDVTLVRLIDAEDLGVLGQDTWVVQSPSGDYPLTRRWGHAIRRNAPWCQGLVWRSRLEPSSLAYVFFSDRQGAATSPLMVASEGNPTGSISFDTAEGETHLRQILVRYSVTLSSSI